MLLMQKSIKRQGPRIQGIKGSREQEKIKRAFTGINWDFFSLGPLKPF